MQRNGRTDRETRRLDRTVYFLVALAGLAERAAFRSWPIRWLVLCILRHADAVTRDFIALSDPEAGPHLAAAMPPTSGHTAQDALHLAASLRWLAEILRVMAAHCRRQAFFGHGLRPTPDMRAPLGRHALDRALAAVEPRDTS